jgi:hypothetical protein
VPTGFQTITWRLGFGGFNSLQALQARMTANRSSVFIKKIVELPL